MGVDTSIYSLLRPIEFTPTLSEAVRNGFDGFEKSYDRAKQAKREAASEAENKAVKASYSKNTNASGDLDKRSFLSDLAKINPERRMQYEDSFRKSEGADLELKSKQLEHSINQTGMVGQLAMSAKDQPSYEAAIKKAGEFGLDTSKMPPQYDPNLIRSFTYNSIKQSERLAAEKSILDEQLKKSQIAKNYADAAKDRVVKNNLTPGEKTADESFGKDAADYYYGGGKATVEKNLQRIDGAINKLKEKPNMTGGISTRIPGLSSDMVQDTVNPEMASVRDDIRGAIQASLRQVLGAQFTEKEGEAIFNRAFNPRLSAEENIKRASAEVEAIRAMANQKDQSMNRFVSQGTLKGYKPEATRLNSMLDSPQSANATPMSKQTPQDAEAIFWAKKNKDDPRAQQILQIHGVK